MESESEEDEYNNDNYSLFTVKLLDGMEDAVIFSVLSWEGSKNGKSETPSTIKLKNLIRKNGGELISPDMDNYEFEIPLFIPSLDENYNLNFINNYKNSLLKKGQLRDLFHADYVLDCIKLGTRVDLNAYKFSTSSFLDYDANEVLNIRTKWSELKRINHKSKRQILHEETGNEKKRINTNASEIALGTKGKLSRHSKELKRSNTTRSTNRPISPPEGRDPYALVDNDTQSIVSLNAPTTKPIYTKSNRDKFDGNSRPRNAHEKSKLTVGSAHQKHYGTVVKSSQVYENIEQQVDEKIDRKQREAEKSNKSEFSKQLFSSTQPKDTNSYASIGADNQPIRSSTPSPDVVHSIGINNHQDNLGQKFGSTGIRGLTKSKPPDYFPVRKIIPCPTLKSQSSHTTTINVETNVRNEIVRPVSPLADQNSHDSIDEDFQSIRSSTPNLNVVRSKANSNQNNSDSKSESSGIPSLTKNPPPSVYSLNHENSFRPISKFQSSHSTKNVENNIRKEIVVPISPFGGSSNDTGSSENIEIYSDEKIENYISSDSESSVFEPITMNPLRATSTISSRCDTNRINLVPAKRLNKPTRRPPALPPMSHTEMQMVVDYIRSKKLFRDTGGNMMWKKLQADKIIKDRTFHTLRNNFRRSILPNLKRFKMTEREYKKFSLLYARIGNTGN